MTHAHYGKEAKKCRDITTTQVARVAGAAAEAVGGELPTALPPTQNRPGLRCHLQELLLRGAMAVIAVG